MNPDESGDVIDLLLKGIETELRFRQQTLGADPELWELSVCTRALSNALDTADATPRTERVICTDQE